MRTPGSGSVFKRPGRPGWYAQVVVGWTEDHNPIYVRKHFSTKTEAVQALPGMRLAGKPKKVPTLQYYYKAFCNGKGATISEDKQRAYRIAFNRLEPFHDTPISEITISDLQERINLTCNSFYPARDVKSLLNRMYRLAAVDGNANPGLPALIELPKLQETKREAFTDEEQLLLWKSYEAGNLNAAAPLIMIYTGMMTGEMRRLTKGMVDLSTQRIVGVGLKTKTRRETDVLFTDDIVPLLQDVISNAPKDRLYPMNEEDFYAMYYQALKDAGITRHLTPYSCRHTTATTLAVNANAAPQTIQRIMRWSSTKMMDRYVHPSEIDAREALSQIRRPATHQLHTEGLQTLMPQDGDIPSEGSSGVKASPGSNPGFSA